MILPVSPKFGVVNNKANVNPKGIAVHSIHGRNFPYLDFVLSPMIHINISLIQSLNLAVSKTSPAVAGFNPNTSV